MWTMFDGIQRTNDWPGEIVNYMQAHPKREIIVSQSIRCKHQIDWNRTQDKRLFIGYNKKFNLFVAWNVEANAVGYINGERIPFELDTKMLSGLQNIADIVCFYVNAGRYGNNHKVYQKVCVFPETFFRYFYDSYESIMRPNRGDGNYKTPVYDFTKPLTVIQ